MSVCTPSYLPLHRLSPVLLMKLHLCWLFLEKYTMMLTHTDIPHNVFLPRMMSKEEDVWKKMGDHYFLYDTVEFVQAFHFYSAWLIMPYFIELGESSQCNCIPWFTSSWFCTVHSCMLMLGRREHLHALFLPRLRQDVEFQGPHLT